MKCILKRTKDGMKLVEMSTGKFYGYIRSDGTAKGERRRLWLIAAIRREIEANGFYETNRS